MDEEIKETTLTKLIRIEERIKNGFEQNDKDHNEIKANMATLTVHVNHENEKMDARIRKLENESLAKADVKVDNKRTKKEVIKENKYTIIISAVVTGIITILVKLVELGLI